MKRAAGKDWGKELLGQSLKKVSGRDWRQGLEAGIGEVGT